LYLFRAAILPKVQQLPSAQDSAVPLICA